MATHNFERGLKFSDRILILGRGKVLKDLRNKELDIKELKGIYRKALQ